MSKEYYNLKKIVKDFTFWVHSNNYEPFELTPKEFRIVMKRKKKELKKEQKRHKIKG